MLGTLPRPPNRHPNNDVDQSYIISMNEQSSTDNQRTLIGTETLPIIEGTVLGIVAWLIGYAVTYTVVAPDVRDSDLHRFIEAFEGEPATYEMVGWVFYNIHLVNTVFRDVPLIGSHTTSFVGGEDGFSLLLYAIPVVLLLLAGAILAIYRGAPDPTSGAVTGLMAAPGYLMFTIAGVFLFEVTIGGATGAPDLVPSIFLAGIMYPLLFTALGGIIGQQLTSR